MANINLYGTLKNVTGEYVASSDQIQYTEGTSVKDVLDSVYVKTYDFTKNASYDEVNVASHTFDSDKNATRIEGIVTINVPSTATYTVQLVCKAPDGQIIIWNEDSNYRKAKESNYYSFKETNLLKFQIIGELYITKIRINSDCSVPVNLSDLYNDSGAVTASIEGDSLIIDYI